MKFLSKGDIHASCSMLKEKHHKKNPPLDSYVKATSFTKYSSKHTGGRIENKR